MDNELKPGKYIGRGIAGGLLLGGLAFLAIRNNAGGKLAIGSSVYEGWAAGLVLISICVALGLMIAGAFFITISILKRDK